MQSKQPRTEVDFGSYLRAKGNTPQYAARTTKRVQAVADGCKFKFIADVLPSTVVEWLADERQSGRLGIRTSNYYLRDAKAFCRWMIKDRRSADNPLAHLSALNANTEDGRERRTPFRPAGPLTN